LANSVQRIKTHEHVKSSQISQSVAKILRFFKMAGDAILDFQICEISLAVSGRPRLIIVLNVVKIGRLVVKTTHFFEFSKWPTPPSWIFEIAKFYWLLGRRGSRHISMPNFVKIGQSVAKILRFFFDFFKMAAAAILDCQIHKMLLADSSSRCQTHHFTKFCQNRSFHCGDVAIFRIFKMAAQPFWIFKIAKFYCLMGSRGSRRISMPNFVKNLAWLCV